MPLFRAVRFNSLPTATQWTIYENITILALWILFSFFPFHSTSLSLSVAFHCFYTHLAVDIDTYIHNIWNGNLCKRADILFIIYQRNAKNHILHSKSKGKHQTPTVIPANKLKSIEHFITQNSELCFVLISCLVWLGGFHLFFRCQSVQFTILKVRCISMSGKIGLTASFVYFQVWMTWRPLFSFKSNIADFSFFPIVPPLFRLLRLWFFSWMNNFSQWKSLAYQMSCKSNDELMRIVLVLRYDWYLCTDWIKLPHFFGGFVCWLSMGKGKRGQRERGTRLFKATKMNIRQFYWVEVRVNCSQLRVACS